MYLYEPVFLAGIVNLTFGEEAESKSETSEE